MVIALICWGKLYVRVFFFFFGLVKVEEEVMVVENNDNGRK